MIYGRNRWEKHRVRVAALHELDAGIVPIAIIWDDGVLRGRGHWRASQKALREDRRTRDRLSCIREGAGEGWYEGVKGIVASRLVGIYGVPCLLFTIENGEARGSGRAPSDPRRWDVPC